MESGFPTSGIAYMSTRRLRSWSGLAVRVETAVSSESHIVSKEFDLMVAYPIDRSIKDMFAPLDEDSQIEIAW